MHIAIIGAGLAGLTCARRLQAAGHDVIVYEKGDGVGGRMSTRQTELGGFDLGAQYFTASSDRFRNEVAAWRKAGWVVPWEGRLVTLDHGVAQAAGRSGSQRLVAVPGMASLAQRLAQDIEIRAGQAVVGLERHGAQWLLSVLCDTVPVAATAGPFDAVILAIPADQALPLLRPVSAFAVRAEGAHLVPCWALILGFQEALNLEYDGAWVQGSRLRWIARDNSKPQRRPGEHWIGHASPQWSQEHLGDDPERVKEKLLKAFHEATGSPVNPIYADVHLWPHAQAAMPLAADCYWDEGERIGVCGDWFAAGLDGCGRIENACLSALALAGAIRPEPLH